MPKTQPRQIGNDVNAGTVQFLLEEVFESSHDHMVRSTFPASNEGAPRDIVIVDDGTSIYVCVKTSRGWFKTAALTAI